MATILLSAAGAAIGGAVGGSVLGLSSVVIGRAIGASLGRAIDQRLLGAGSEPVETGRLDRYRITGASEGAPVARVWGRVRVGGQVIWATRFREHVEEESVGGKGGPRQATARRYSYSVSLAIGLCEGEIAKVGRVWADGIEIPREDLVMRVYPGDETQQPDPRIEAVEGAGNAPAYRGTAYVVIEDLNLDRFGNRVPQFSFEVVRPAREDMLPDGSMPLSQAVSGVALVPGTGEYALATTPVHYEGEFGHVRSGNVHTPGGRTDFAVSMEHLREELPDCGSAVLVVCWFGDDLRCGACSLKPKVEQTEFDASAMPWTVSGLTRAGAETVGELEDRPVYGGTPTDQSVVEAIRALRAEGKAVVFYPFILMEQMSGNALTDPWTGEAGQPPLPWRGRITTSLAPSLPGTPDRTAAAEGEVAAFFGQAAPGDFLPGDESVGYAGPEEWSFRRFILHYAHLCAVAGGVDAFCIGSEMRSLTQIRGAGDSFPSVAALRQLATEVRAILGPEARIGYAADWSEYFGYQPQDGSGDVYYHLDPLWADPAIDFVGIDNYMRLSDWREGGDHADAAAGAIYDLDYLKGNVAGGEGFDWYYASDADRAAQIRTPIADGAEGFAPMEPERLIAPSGDISSDAFGGGATAASDVVFSARVPLPAAPADGLLFERGGSGRGMLLGLRDGGATLRFRAGDGSGKSQSDGETVILDLPVADLPFDGHVHELVWECRMAPARLRLWIDGALAGEATLTDGGDLIAWAGGAGGGFGAETTTNIPGEPLTGWPVPVDGLLHMYDGLALRQPAESAWIYRYKDLRNWWSRRHRERRGGRPLLQPTAWVPEAKPIWFTEYGCAAVDKGTNQPNKFLDPKSSESRLPHFSLGTRDDLIQAQYLRAMAEFWRAPENNPVSSVYGGPMVDMARAHAWAWDTRPYPHFPGLSDLWADADNYERGHWLNGRVTAEALPAVVAEICAGAGLGEVDVARLWGSVRGYSLAETAGARAALQPLMLGYGFEAAERDGSLRFRMRDGRAGVALAREALALSDEIEGAVETARARGGETPGRVRLGHVEADGDFEAAATEAAHPAGPAETVAGSELPLVLTAGEGRGVAERWLAEARVARDRARFALPPSRYALGAGDVVALEEGGVVSNWRIDHVDQGSARLVEAVRVEPGAYRPARAVDRRPAPRDFTLPVPVVARFLDLPLLTGREAPDAPHLAVTARPWPGTVAVYSAAQDAGYALDTLIESAAVIGVTETPLPAAQPGLWDRGPALRVRLSGGALASEEQPALLAGANAMAIGDGSADLWEVFQFAEATLVGPDRWDLSLRLRGQAGTDALMPPSWPAGSAVVLLDAALRQIAHGPAERGLERHYRIGPAARPLDDATFHHRVESVAGAGWRPYAPVHLRADRSGGDLAFAWMRRTRIDGDGWAGADVPLGEERERYLVRVLKDGSVRREAMTEAPRWTYGAAEQAADSVTAPFTVEVAQMSDRVGAGLFRRIEIDD